MPSSRTIVLWALEPDVRASNSSETAWFVFGSLNLAGVVRTPPSRAPLVKTFAPCLSVARVRPIEFLAYSIGDTPDQP